MQTTPEYQARVAAEVAARYGVIVAPDAVQIVPRGVSSFPGYIYEGNQLVPIVKQGHGDALKSRISASYREAARKRRLGKALRNAEADAAPKPERDPEANKARIARMKAQAADRAATIRAMAEAGADMGQIAAHMGITYDSVKKYLAFWNIEAKPRKSPRLEREQQRKAATIALSAGGQRTIDELMEATGLSWDGTYAYLRRHKIPFRKIERVADLEKQKATRRARMRAKAEALRAAGLAKAEQRKAAEDARIAARREKVAELFKAGKNGKEIADALGISRGPVWGDIKALGLRRQDYPLPISKTAARHQRYRSRCMSLEQRREEVAQMCADGMTVAAIAIKLGCSYQAVQRDRQALGIRAPVTPSGHVGNPALVARVAAMRARKMSLREIAVALSMSKSTAHRLICAVEAA
jgi:DNA-binding CsgD family transcriptional regulator